MATDTKTDSVTDSKLSTEESAAGELAAGESAVEAQSVATEGDATPKAARKSKKASRGPKPSDSKPSFEGPYAIVQWGDRQLRVAPGQKIIVDRLEGSVGEQINFDRVLVLSSIGAENSGAAIIGAPTISGALVRAKIVGHDKGKKVIIYKKKRRTGYTKSQGARHFRTTIQIEEIVATR